MPSPDDRPALHGPGDIIRWGSVTLHCAASRSSMHASVRESAGMGFMGDSLTGWGSPRWLPGRDVARTYACNAPRVPDTTRTRAAPRRLRGPPRHLICQIVPRFFKEGLIVKLSSVFVTLSTALLVAAGAHAEPVAAPADAAPMLTQVQFAGQALQLGERDGRCVLLRGETLVMPLAISAPCGFSPDRRGKVRIEPFNRGSRIVLVEHVRPGPWMADVERPSCIRESQAVREIRGVLEAGTVITSGRCGHGSTDQKLFVAGFDW
jgi:hypothetical protein